MELGLGLGRKGLRGMGVLRSGGGDSLAVSSLRGTRPVWGFQGGGGGRGDGAEQRKEGLAQHSLAEGSHWVGDGAGEKADLTAPPPHPQRDRVGAGRCLSVRPLGTVM